MTYIKERLTLAQLAYLDGVNPSKAASSILLDQRTITALLVMARESLELRAERDALQASNERMEAALNAVADLINDSHGVAGLHLNGDVAPWDELRTGGPYEEWLVAFDTALSTQPVETDEERDARRASVLNTVIQPYTRWHPMFAARMARAIAESDKKARGS